ncbi:2-C-methyl-D-erythritol 4-phosphate cytidylyltransferase [Photobacterium japonica]|uniref:2-C-methyl-D-erythritol 4-phosphate cytidylyltransferase n=1 Tax=Photobacterium japonica TaxID=2910235 RepID=UPI003D0A8680
MILSEKMIAVVPAAGVGSRMAADRPKQYLQIAGKTILEHTVARLLQHPSIAQVIIAVSEDDPYFPQLPLATDPRVIRVDGGAERADSVFAGLAAIDDPDTWVLVHDAARPCLHLSDVDALIQGAQASPFGAILAAPVRDTMKRGNGAGGIASTVDRTDLWHALTPQMFRAGLLKHALEQALADGAVITDEASAMEHAQQTPQLVKGRADNLKVTQPEDLALAAFYLETMMREAQ